MQNYAVVQKQTQLRLGKGSIQHIKAPHMESTSSGGSESKQLLRLSSNMKPLAVVGTYI